MAFFDSDEKKESFQFIEEANKKSEFMCRIYALISGAVVITMGSLSVISVLFWMKNKDFDANHLFHPFKLMYVLKYLYLKTLYIVVLTRIHFCPPIKIQ